MVPSRRLTRGRVGPGAALLLAGLAVAPSGVVAQGTDDARTILRGRVLDAETLRPLHGAFVAPRGSDTGFLTDSAGSFALPVPTDAVHRLYAELLGYRTAHLDVPAVDAERPLEIRLSPDPVALAGIDVLVDRFQRRRRFHAGSVRAFERETLLTSPAGDAFDFVRFRVGAMVQPCPGDAWGLCVLRRGRLTRTQVCIDERPALGGADELRAYQPQDFYLVEVYDWGAQVRFYTTAFVESQVRRGRSLFPLGFGC